MKLKLHTEIEDVIKDIQDNKLDLFQIILEYEKKIELLEEQLAFKNNEFDDKLGELDDIISDLEMLSKRLNRFK